MQRTRATSRYLLIWFRVSGFGIVLFVEFWIGGKVISYAEQSRALSFLECPVVSQNYAAFTEEVVALIEESLRKLFSLGVRNIMVTTLAPLNCLPAMTIFTGFTACASNATVDDVEFRHNSRLEATLVSLSRELPGVNFILLRLGDALRQIQTNTTLFSKCHLTFRNTKKIKKPSAVQYSNERIATSQQLQLFSTSYRRRKMLIVFLIFNF